MKKKGKIEIVRKIEKERKKRNRSEIRNGVLENCQAPESDTELDAVVP